MMATRRRYGRTDWRISEINMTPPVVYGARGSGSPSVQTLLSETIPVRL